MENLSVYKATCIRCKRFSLRGNQYEVKGCSVCDDCLTGEEADNIQVQLLKEHNAVLVRQ